jgi:hypothetical protein
LCKTTSPSEVKELEVTPGLIEFLEELSFSGYRELGFDKLILIEGLIDVTTGKQLLSLQKIEDQIVTLPFMEIT